MSILGAVVLYDEGFTAMESEAWKRSLNQYGKEQETNNSSGFEIPYWQQRRWMCLPKLVGTTGT